MKIVRCLVGGVAACTAVFFAGWLGFAAISWAGYSRIGVDRRADPALDRVMPVYDVAERHEAKVHAPADVTFQAATDFSLEQSPVIRAIFRGRELFLGASHDNRTRPNQSLLAEMKALGWGTLAEEPGRLIIMGAVTRPWQAHVVFKALPDSEFTSFHAPDYVKIVWTLEVQPLSRSTSVFRTVTRVQTTDPEARQKFRRYWALFSPGIWLIRKEALRLVRAEAERVFKN